MSWHDCHLSARPKFPPPPLTLNSRPWLPPLPSLKRRSSPKCPT
uniref:Uncharacterized protein MANES_14G060900 n=1 Tax=Rhizophora mucronata TaxID=61149 RepID=A0A2P2P3Q7_RHIMU